MKVKATATIETRQRNDVNVVQIEGVVKSIKENGDNVVISLEWRNRDQKTSFTAISKRDTLMSPGTDLADFTRIYMQKDTHVRVYGLLVGGKVVARSIEINLENGEPDPQPTENPKAAKPRSKKKAKAKESAPEYVQDELATDEYGTEVPEEAKLPEDH